VNKDREGLFSAFAHQRLKKRDAGGPDIRKMVLFERGGGLWVDLF